MEEYKYIRRTTDSVGGWMFLICGTFGTIMHLVLLFSTKHPFMLLVMIPFPIAIYAGYFYLTKQRRHYVKKDANDTISIDRGPIYPDIVFNMNEVSIVTIVNGELRIGLVSNKEYTIKLNLLSVFDIKKIERLFEI